VIVLAFDGPRAPAPAHRRFLQVIAAGAAGNAIDRFGRSPGPGRGAVVDWIKAPFYGPVFNLADVALRAGGCARSSSRSAPSTCERPLPVQKIDAAHNAPLRARHAAPAMTTPLIVHDPPGAQ